MNNQISKQGRPVGWGRSCIPLFAEVFRVRASRQGAAGRRGSVRGHVVASGQPAGNSRRLPRSFSFLGERLSRTIRKGTQAGGLARKSRSIRSGTWPRDLSERAQTFQGPFFRLVQPMVGLGGRGRSQRRSRQEPMGAAALPGLKPGPKPKPKPKPKRLRQAPKQRRTRVPVPMATARPDPGLDPVQAPTTEGKASEIPGNKAIVRKVVPVVSETGPTAPAEVSPETAWVQLWQTVLGAKDAPPIDSAGIDSSKTVRSPRFEANALSTPTPRLPAILFEADPGSIAPKLPSASQQAPGESIDEPPKLGDMPDPERVPGDSSGQTRFVGRDAETESSDSKTGFGRIPFVQAIQRDPDTLFVQWDFPENAPRRMDDASGELSLTDPARAGAPSGGLGFEEDQRDWRIRIHYGPESSVTLIEHRIPEQTRHAFLAQPLDSAARSLELGYVDHQANWVRVATGEQLGDGESRLSNSRSDNPAAHVPLSPGALDAVDTPRHRQPPRPSRVSRGPDDGIESMERAYRPIEDPRENEIGHPRDPLRPQASPSDLYPMDAPILERRFPTRKQSVQLHLLSWNTPEISGVGNSESWVHSEHGQTAFEQESDDDSSDSNRESIPICGSPKWMAPSELQRETVPSSDFPISLHPTGKAADRNFWMNIQAEVILYGSTEPDARLRVSDLAIPLRADGTFSFRFLLPDGSYRVPVRAESADGVEFRQVEVAFQRQTECLGRVEAYPFPVQRGLPEPFEGVRSAIPMPTQATQEQECPR